MDQTTLGLLLLFGIPAGIIGWVIVTQIQNSRREQQRLVTIDLFRLSWGDQICDDLVKRSVQIDMTPEMVKLAWGAPNYVDKQEITKTGITKERWVYGIPRKNAQYIWFRNGQVNKINL